MTEAAAIEAGCCISQEETRSSRFVAVCCYIHGINGKSAVWAARQKLPLCTTTGQQFLGIAF